MTDYILDALKSRLEAIQAKIKAREGRPGYEDNVAECKEAARQLEAEIASREAAALNGTSPE